MAGEHPVRPGEADPSLHEAAAAGVTVVRDGVRQDAAFESGVRPVVVNVEQRRMGRGLTAFIVVAVSLVLLGLVGCSASCAAMFGGVTAAVAPASSTDSSGPSVAVFHMDQGIGSTSGITPELVRSVVSRVENDPSIAALVVRVDCSGGGAAASQEIASYFAGCSKPVVFSVGSICASGAYMAASQADWVVAGPMSNVGAIGVIMSLYDLQGLYEKLGVDVEVVKSADSKDIGASYRSLTEEERAVLQEQVDEMNALFIAMVAQGRGVDEETARSWATGVACLGSDALEMGMIDEVGTYDDALNRAAELGGISNGRYGVVSVDPVYSSGLNMLRALLDL